MSAQDEIERAYRLVCDESRDASQENYRRDVTARAEAYAHALQLLRAEACNPDKDGESITEALFRIDAERKQAQRAAELEAKRSDAMSKRAEQAEADAARLRDMLAQGTETVSLDYQREVDWHNAASDVLLEMRDRPWFNEQPDPQGEDGGSGMSFVDADDLEVSVLNDSPEILNTGSETLTIRESNQGEPDTAEGRVNNLYAAIRDHLMSHVCGFTTKYYLYDVLQPHEIDKLAENLAGYLNHAGVTGQAQPAE